jgi:hypothetical protein
MTITVLCPHGHAVAIDETPARAVACPRCGAVFSSAGEAPSVPSLPGAMAARSERRKSRDEDEEDEDDDRPRRRKRRDDDDDDDDDKVRGGPPPKRPTAPPPRPAARRRAKEDEPDDEDDAEEDDEPFDAPVLTRKQRQMNMVRLGVLFHIIKLWIYLAALLFGVITMPLILFIAAFGGGWLGKLLIQITFNLAMTFAPIAGMVGSVLCIWIPPRSEARGTIVVSLIFDVLAPFFGLFQLIMWFGWFVTFDDRVERLIDYMFIARMACTLTAWWLFQLYLRKVSFYIRETLLASESLNVIVHLLIATVIGPTLVVATFLVLVFVGGGLIVLILFFACVGWLIYFAVTFPIRQFRLLFLVRAKIWDKYLKPDDDD